MSGSPPPETAETPPDAATLSVWLGAGAAVEDISLAPLGADAAFAGRLSRIAIRPGPPASVVVKQPSTDPNVRGLLVQLGMYAREARFYREIAPGCPVRVPMLLAVTGPEDAPTLVLEDLADARPGDQAAGLSPSKAEPVARAIAGLHARWWDRAESEAAWLPSLDAGPDMASFYTRCWPAFLDRFGDDLPDWLKIAGAGAGAVMAAARRDLAETPVTLLHGDLRLDNILFLPDGTPAFVDWQTCVRGRGAFDLAYLAAGNLLSHDVSEIDRLIAAYHDSLTTHGVTGYSLDALRIDYRRAIGFLLARTVTAGASLGFAAGPAHERFRLALARWGDAAERCGAADDLVAAVRRSVSGA